MKYVSFLITCLVIVVSSIGLTAQNRIGEITYNRKTDYIKIQSELPYNTQADIDRSKLSRGSWENKGENYLLSFKNDESLYKEKEEVDAYGGYSWNEDVYILTRDYDKKKRKDIIEMFGKKYLIDEELPRIKWKMKTEMREIAGYLCMKAVSIDTFRNQNITAWFTSDIPVSGGPEGWYGLPGMILAIDINDGTAIIEATHVKILAEDFDVPFPKKMKGTSISVAEFEKKRSKYISRKIRAERNPYWELRY